MEFIKKFFAKPNLESKAQKLVYTIWLLAIVFIAVSLITILTSGFGASSSDLGIGVMSVIILTFIRNKLIEVWS